MSVSESYNKAKRKTRKRKKKTRPIKVDNAIYSLNNTVDENFEKVTFCESAPAPTIEFLWCIFWSVLGNFSK